MKKSRKPLLFLFPSRGLRSTVADAQKRRASTSGCSVLGSCRVTKQSQKATLGAAVHPPPSSSPWKRDRFRPSVCARREIRYRRVCLKSPEKREGKRTSLSRSLGIAALFDWLFSTKNRVTSISTEGFTTATDLLSQWNIKAMTTVWDHRRRQCPHNTTCKTYGAGLFVSVGS